MSNFPAALCASYVDLKETNRSTDGCFPTLLLGYLRFRAKTTGGVITTTLDKLASFFKISIGFLRKSLEKLNKLAVITINTTLNQKGYKRTTIKVNSNENSFFDYEKIRTITNYTNDNELSLLYGFIAFKLNAYDKLNQPSWVKLIEDRVWWQLNTKLITEHFAISERTAFRKLKELESLYLIEKKRIGLKSYYTINHEIYSEIEKEYSNGLIKKRPSCDFVSDFTANSEPPSLNNTYTGKEDIYINNNTRDSDINLNNIDSIGVELTKRQAAYLLAAIKITLRKVNGFADEIFSWLKFSILNPCQRANTTGFRHAVNRFIKILREGKLKMPYGYNKYTEEGREYWNDVLARENKSNQRTQTDINELVDRSEMFQQETSLNDFVVEQEKFPRRVSGEFSKKEEPSERETRLLNEQAERVAKAIVDNSKEHTEHNAIRLDYLNDWLHRCLRQGADRQRVQQILNGIGG